MCKVLLMAGLKPNKIDKAIAFTQKMGEIMSKGNQDGLGYTAMRKDGTLFGKRWLENDYAWLDRLEPDAYAVKANSKFPGMIDDKDLQSETPEMNAYGDENWSDVVSIMLHTRYATSAKGMRNTHPFVTPDNKVALIHNGVIKNDNEFKLTLSTCDSEAILVSYLDRKVLAEPKNIQLVADDLEGYYIAGVMSAENKTLDIFRYSGGLYFAYVHELGCYVFSTSDRDIVDACKALEFSCGTSFEFKSNHYMRIDAVTGNLITMLKFKKNETYSTYTSHTWPGARDYKPPYDITKSTASSGVLKKFSKLEVQETIHKLVSGE